MEVQYEARSDSQILQQFGERFRRERLQANWTQAQLAQKAGVSLKTLQNLEQGCNTSLETILRILRAFGATTQLDTILPDEGLSPVQLVAMQGKKRKRASSMRVQDCFSDKGEWTW